MNHLPGHLWACFLFALQLIVVLGRRSSCTNCPVENGFYFLLQWLSFRRSSIHPQGLKRWREIFLDKTCRCQTKLDWRISNSFCSCLRETKLPSLKKMSLNWLQIFKKKRFLCGSKAHMRELSNIRLQGYCSMCAHKGIKLGLIWMPNNKMYECWLQIKTKSFFTESYVHIGSLQSIWMT